MVPESMVLKLLLYSPLNSPLLTSLRKLELDDVSSHINPSSNESAHTYDVERQRQLQHIREYGSVSLNHFIALTHVSFKCRTPCQFLLSLLSDLPCLEFLLLQWPVVDAAEDHVGTFLPRVESLGSFLQATPQCTVRIRAIPQATKRYEPLLKNFKQLTLGRRSVW
jgi:hypothetical protein